MSEQAQSEFTESSLKWTFFLKLWRTPAVSSMFVDSLELALAVLDDGVVHIVGLLVVV